MEKVTIAGLAERFDGFLVDQFGVLLHGSGAYPGAVHGLEYLRTHGKPVVILTNSGRRASYTEARLAHHGFDRCLYDAVISSGEVTYRLLRDTFSPNYVPRVWCIPSEFEASPLDGLRTLAASSPETADLIMLMSLPDDNLTEQEWAAHLAQAASQRVPMICANPDEVRLVESGVTFGTGAVAKRYQQEGGSVKFIGKPYSAIYQFALRILSHLSRDRIVAIGDSLDHDIAGGRAAGICTALTRTGIYAQMPPRERMAMLERSACRPDFDLMEFA